MGVLLGCLSIFIVVSVHARFSIVDVPDAWMSGWGFVIHIIIFLVAIRGGTAIVHAIRPSLSFCGLADRVSATVQLFAKGRKSKNEEGDTCKHVLTHLLQGPKVPCSSGTRLLGNRKSSLKRSRPWQLETTEPPLNFQDPGSN